MDAAYKVGDYSILDTGERGEVVEVGIRSTKIKTRDDILITIPNSIMSTTKIINHALAKKPEPRVRVRSFGDSAIHFQLLVRVQDPRHRGRETHNLLKMIHAAFQEQNIEIPVPQWDVHLKEVKGSGFKADG